MSNLKNAILAETVTLTLSDAAQCTVCPKSPDTQFKASSWNNVVNISYCYTTFL